MTEPKSFVIRRSFLIPLGILLTLAAALLAVSIHKGEPTGKVIILGCMILPALLLFVESAFRKVVVARQSVTAHKFLRSKTLNFDAITAVETVQVRKRVFLTLCADDEFLILSNAYGDFPGMVQALLPLVPQGAISEETVKMAAAPPVKSTDILSCWLAVALLALLLYIQLATSP